MRRIGVTALFLGTALGLGGCAWIETSPAGPLVEAVLRVSILSDGRTVVLDATGSVGNDLSFYWDLGVGTPGIIVGAPIVRHTYGIGTYVARLRVRGRGGTASGTVGGRPGDPPGGGTPDTPEWIYDWTYAVVDTAQRNSPTAIILVIGIDRMPGGSAFWSGNLTFYGAASLARSGTLTYRWEVVRVHPTTRVPMAHAWDDYPEYIVNENATWREWLRGPPCSATPPWHYRVTLTVRDANWQEDTAVTFIRVH